MKTKQMLMIAVAVVIIYFLFFRGSSGFQNFPGGSVTALPRQAGSERSTAFSYGKGALSLWGSEIEDQP
jgi:hypothetical protein